MTELSDTQKNQLRALIAEAYNLDEMKDLCLYLRVEPENVGVETTRRGFARELVSYFERRGQLGELIKQISNERPTMIQNSGLLEPIDHYDHHEEYEYVTTSTSGDNTGFWIGVIFVVALMAIIVWYVDSNAQKQSELRDSNAFITGYFSLLDGNDCQNAWDRLSGDYRVNKYSTGYTPYCQYWFSFRKVEILKLEVVDETDTTASVEVVLALTNSDNTVVNQSAAYRLTRLTATDPWIISDSSP